MSENTSVATIEKNEIAGFSSASAFELLMRQAKLISSSSLVPEQFSIFDKSGKLKSREEQSYALSNATIAMEMAGRIGASPLMVCQNLYIVHGRPGWSSQFIIAAINASKKFSPLRFDMSEEEPEKEYSCQVTEWENGKKVTKTVKEKIKNRTCVAWAIENGTGERLESPPVSLAMAVQEGWFSKNGSKWPTMPELMLRYRTATLFGRLYAPELLMGIRAEEELHDIIDITPEQTTKQAKAADIAGRFADSKPVAEAVPVEDVQPDPQADEKSDIVIPATDEKPALLQQVYAALGNLFESTGEYADDAVDRLTNGKFGDQVALEQATDEVLANVLFAINREQSK